MKKRATPRARAAARPAARGPTRPATRPTRKTASPVARIPKTAAALRTHVRKIVAGLKRAHPDAHCELDHRNAYELLVATILSAQTTDKRVNMVTPELFRRYPDAASLAAADPTAVEEIVKSTGFYRAKTRSILGMARAVVEDHDGRIPDTMEELTTLPGVGRKTANVVLGNAFGKNEGIVVDTHVKRLVVRLGITDETDAEKVEQVLLPLVPRRDWTLFSHLLIFHGRRVCVARLPRCGDCVLNRICPSARV